MLIALIERGILLLTFSVYSTRTRKKKTWWQPRRYEINVYIYIYRQFFYTLINGRVLKQKKKDINFLCVKMIGIYWFSKSQKENIVFFPSFSFVSYTIILFFLSILLTTKINIYAFLLCLCFFFLHFSHHFFVRRPSLYCISTTVLKSIELTTSYSIQTRKMFKINWFSQTNENNVSFITD